jgi:AcrR family transcriptional regulator
MSARTTSRALERREQRRQDIVDTASKLFVQNGYESVTLRAIAEELGYAHATLYRYFPDKFSVLAEICRQTFAQLLTQVHELQAQIVDERELLFETSRRFIAFALTHPHHFRTVFMGTGNWGGVDSGKYIDAVGRDCFAALVKVFQSSWHLNHETAGTLEAHVWWVSLFGTAQVFLASGEDANLSNRQTLLEVQLSALWNGLQRQA